MYFQFVHVAPKPHPNKSSLSVGGDNRCDPLPVHLHGDPLPALPVSISLLGGVLPLLCVSASHHVQNEPQGALLSTAAVTITVLIGSTGGPRLSFPLCQSRETS